MKKNNRRQLAIIHKCGITSLHRQNPYITAWWSAAFPGFGQYLLNQYVRATVLTLFEVILNTLARINEAIVYTYCGKFELAKSVLQPRWVLGYTIIYFYAIWDTYRSTLIQNKVCHLAELENERLDCMIFTSSEIKYLEPKKPYITVIYSFLFPGLGQLYNHQFCLAFYAMIWWVIYMALSRSHESLVMLITGNIQGSVSILNPHWLLFMPSVLGGSAHHAFITSKKHDRLFRLEQRQFLLERYQDSDVHIFT